MMPSIPPVATSLPSGLRAVTLKRLRIRRVSSVQLDTPLIGAGLVTRARKESGPPGFGLRASAKIGGSTRGMVAVCASEALAQTHHHPATTTLLKIRFMTRPSTRMVVGGILVTRHG